MFLFRPEIEIRKAQQRSMSVAKRQHLDRSNSLTKQAAMFVHQTDVKGRIGRRKSRIDYLTTISTVKNHPVF